MTKAATIRWDDIDPTGSGANGILYIITVHWCLMRAAFTGQFVLIISTITKTVPSNAW